MRRLDAIVCLAICIFIRRINMPSFAKKEGAGAGEKEGLNDVFAGRQIQDTMQVRIDARHFQFTY